MCDRRTTQPHNCANTKLPVTGCNESCFIISCSLNKCYARLPGVVVEPCLEQFRCSDGKDRNNFATAQLCNCKTAKYYDKLTLCGCTIGQSDGCVVRWLHGYAAMRLGSCVVMRLKLVIFHQPSYISHLYCPCFLIVSIVFFAKSKI